MTDPSYPRRTAAGVRVFGLAIVAVCFIGSVRAPAQAERAATRPSEIAAFGAIESLHPDFGSGSDLGVVAGADFTRFFRTPVLPSLELRSGFTGGGAVANERFLAIGGRFEMRLRPGSRYHPYANLLIGSGTITFTHPVGNYKSDNSTVYNYGAGLDYDLRHHLSGRVEFQQQHWNLGSTTTPQPLAPFMIDVGMRYRIPFKRHAQ